MTSTSNEIPTRLLAAGEVLFEIGDEGDTVFVLVSGQLDVLAPSADGADTLVGQVAPGELAGEITAVIGGKRTATVRAASESSVQILDANAFDRWLEQHPDRAATLAAEARERIDRTRVARAVTDLIGHGNDGVVEEMINLIEWTRLSVGEMLFEQGDQSDAAYILVAGQMRVVAHDVDDYVTLDARIGRGDLLGEMGVIESAPRSAGARAIRDCTLARIPKAAFEDITARHPALMLPLVRKIIERVGSRGQRPAHAGTVAIAITTDDPPVDLAELIAEEISRFGTVAHLSPERVEQFMQRRGIAHAATGTAAEARLTDFLHEADVTHQWVILECDGADSDWTRRALGSADRIVLVCSSRPDTRERNEIQHICSLVESAGDHELWVAPVHGSRRRPRDTADLLQLTSASRPLHVRHDDERSIRRLARMLSGNGLGVALSGGGARSFAQLGALRALGESGIEVDAIAGTSMGSVVGAMLAMTDDIGETIRAGRAEFEGVNLLDYTVPIASLFSAKRIGDGMTKVFGSWDIVDTLIPFRCMSTNLTKAELVEHRSGNLARAVRASTSLPGVFPPVTHNGDLLVDGGVLENLPARPLRRDPGIRTVVAIDVAPPGGPQAPYDYGMSLTATDIVRQRLSGETNAYPPLAHTVMSSMLVGSSKARNTSLNNDDIDLYLSLTVDGVKLLDFDALGLAMDRGYADATKQLVGWPGPN